MNEGLRLYPTNVTHKTCTYELSEAALVMLRDGIELAICAPKKWTSMMLGTVVFR
jgi:hypothetical protein